MENIQDIDIKRLEVNKGQIEGLPKNPRFIRDERFKALVKSIEDAPEMMWLRELIVVEHGNKFVVVGGNMRFRACKELGWESVPSKVLPADTPPKKLREYARKDNIAFGEEDWDATANEWDAEELQEWGVELPMDWDVDGQGDATATEDDFDEAEVTESICKRGEVWKLGEHRLMCGDSTNADDVAILMQGETADISFFFPPYNAGFGANLTKDNGRESKYIDFNDNKPQDEYCEFLQSAIDNAMEHSQYVFCNIQMLANNKRALVELMHNNINRLGDVIIWDKGHAQPQLAERVLNSVFEFALVFHDKGTRAIGTNNFHGTLDNIVHIKPTRNEYSKEHNAVFPVELAAHFISNFSTESVLDLFGGSGTTIIAAEQLNRKCRMMELDPHYCDVIIARWEKLTGQKAERISDG